MQALITHLREVGTLPTDAQKRALGPHLAGYMTRMERLYASLEKWEHEYNSPVLDVPQMLAGSQDMAILIQGVTPHNLEDMLDISALVTDTSVRVSNLKTLEKDSVETLNAKLRELDVKLQPNYIAFVGQYGGRLPDAAKPIAMDSRRVERLIDTLSKQGRSKTMDVTDLLDSSNNTDIRLREMIMEQYKTTTVPLAYIGAFLADKCKPQISAVVEVRPLERSDVQRNFQAELGRLDNIRKYIARLNAIVTFASPTDIASSTVINDAINVAAINTRYSAIQTALSLLTARCCNCANKNPLASETCSRHLYCSGCSTLLSNGCPVCYFESRLIVRRHQNTTSKNVTSSEFCTPVNHDVNSERDL